MNKTTNTVSNSEFNSQAKRAANKLLQLTQSIADKMIKRSDDSRQPTGISPMAWIGFTMKQEVTEGLDMYADVIAKQDDQQALLRLSGIVLSKNADGNDVFNSLTLLFAVDEDGAQAVVSKGANAKREDIAQLLVEETTQIQLMRMSNNSSLNAADNTRTGRMFDIELSQPTAEQVSLHDINGDAITPKELADNIDAVLATLKDRA